MEALLGSITALTQERDKLRAQAHVSEGVSYTLKAEISKLKVDIETSSKEKLTLENNVAHWKANYESLKKSHDALRDEATRKNEEYKALDARFKTLQDAKISSDQRSNKLMVELARKAVQQKAFYLSRASKLAVDPKTLCLDDDPVADVQNTSEPSVPVGPTDGNQVATGAGTVPEMEGQQVDALLAEIQELKSKLNQANQDAAMKLVNLDAVYAATYAKALSGQQLWGAALSVISSCAGRCYVELRGAELSGHILSGVHGAYAEAEKARGEAKEQGVTLLERHAQEPTFTDKWIPDTTASMGDAPGAAPPAAVLEDMGVEAPLPMDAPAPLAFSPVQADTVAQQKMAGMEMDTAVAENEAAEVSP